ncbi:MAG: ABC transporter substrate-binding protein [Candidatus Cloacimonetes bacterium]|nr:ABC transporter substrate-binding protein [Candidatus Cloacimonadota bacterium]
MFRKIYFVVLITFLLIISCQKVEKPNTAKRYIITSPEVAEIVCTLEGTVNIVGVTSECNYPVKLKNIEKIGNFGKVNFERIIELEPTIVFTSGLEQETLASELSKLDIRVEKIYPHSVQEMIESIRTIGDIIGCKERSEFVADSLQTCIHQLTVSSDSTIPPKVYIEIYNNPVMSVSDRSFVGELVEIAGGDNIFSQLPRDYSRIDPEKVIEADPDIIILTYPGVTSEQIKNRKGWEDISACRNDKIYTNREINPDLIVRASPRVVEGLKILQKVFHEAD